MSKKNIIGLGSTALLGSFTNTSLEPVVKYKESKHQLHKQKRCVENCPYCKKTKGESND